MLKKMWPVVLLVAGMLQAAQSDVVVVSDVGGIYPPGQTAAKDGDSVRIKAVVTPIRADSVWAAARSIVDTTRFLGNPNDIPLYDDGKHDDGLANDGIYATDWIPVAGRTAYNRVTVYALEDTFWNYAVGVIGIDNFSPFIGRTEVVYPNGQTAAKNGDQVRVRTYMDDVSSYVDISLMIDNSGSMADTATGDTISKLEAAQLAADTFLTQLADSDRADLWTFYGGTFSRTSEETLKVALTYNKQEVIDSINALVADQWTPLYDATVEAVMYVDSLSNRIAAAIILTDGIDAGPGGAGTGSNEYTRTDCYFLPIPVFTIGFGDTADIDTAFLDSVALTSGGKFYIAPNAAQLDSIYRDIQTIIANINSPKGISKAWLDGQPVGADTMVMYFDDGDHDDYMYQDSIWGTSLFTINTSILSDSVLLSIKALDVAYNEKTSSVYIKIDNILPVVDTLHVTYPSGKNVVHNGEKVFFTLHAVDTGTISGINEVYLDATQIGGPEHVVMRDDGTGNDAVAGDGIYTSDSIEVNTDTYSGTAAVYAYVKDIAGNTVVSAGGVVVDNIPPVITDIRVIYPDGQMAVKQGDSLVITAEITDDVSGVDSVVIDLTSITGGVYTMVDDGSGYDENAGDNVYTWAGVVTATTTQTEQFTITAYDNEGNSTSVNSTVTVDNTPPTSAFSFVNLDPDNIYANGDYIHIRVVNAGETGLTVRADFSLIDSYYIPGSETWTDNGDGTYDIVYRISDNNTRADGQYAIPVTLYDRALNSSTHTIQLYLDNHGVHVDTVYLADADNIIGTIDTVYATLSDDKGVIEAEFFVDAVTNNGEGIPLSLDNPGAATVNGYAVLDIDNVKYLEDGRHKLFVHGKDSTGLWGSFKALEFVVDREAPQIENVQVVYPNGKSVVRDGDVVKIKAHVIDNTSGLDSLWIDGTNLNGDADILMHDDGTSGDDVAGDNIYTAAITINTGGNNGALGFDIHALDYVPNERVITSYVMVDNTPPGALTIRVLDSDNIYRNGEEVHLEAITDTAGYEVSADFSRIDAGYLTGAETVQDNGDGTYSITYRITETNTVPDGGYYVVVRAEDEAGNYVIDSVLLYLDNSGVEVDTLYLSDADNIIGSPDTIHAVLSDNKGVIEAEFFVDAVTNNGEGIPLSLDNPGAATVNGYAVLDIDNVKYLEDGRHKLFVHGKDSTGLWGSFKALEFVVDREAPQIENVQVVYPNGKSVVRDGDVVKIKAHVIDNTSGLDSLWIDGTNLNGDADILMHDDGTSGDDVAGDNIYTAAITINTGGNNGALGFDIHALDYVPNERVITSYVMVDNTPPGALTIRVLDSDNIYRNGEEVHLEAITDTAGYEVSADFSRIDAGYLTGAETVQDNGDGTYSITYRITETNTVPDGGYYVVVRAEDEAGNYVIDSVLLYLDNSGPMVSEVDFVIDPKNDNILNAPDTIIALATDNKGIDAAEYFIDNTGNDGTGIPMILDNPGSDTTYIRAYFDINAISEGHHTVYVHAKDSTGIWGDYASLEFVVDVTPPSIDKVTVTYPEGQTEARAGQTITITALVKDRITSVDPATVILNAENINGDTAVLMVDDGTGGDKVAGDNVYTARVEITNTQTGTFTFTVSASDIVPNTDSKTGEVTFDNEAPYISVSYSPQPKQKDEVYQNRILLTVSTHDTPISTNLKAVIFDVYNNAGDIVYHKDVNKIPDELRFKNEVPLVVGFNRIVVKAIDHVGNVSVFEDTITYVVPEVSEVVGPDGDTVKAPDGTMLIIPPGALLENTEIKIKTIPPSLLPPPLDTGVVIIKAGHEITPHGIDFHKPVTLILPYTTYDLDPDHDGVMNYSPDSLTVFYYDENDWVKVGEAEVDTVHKSVSVTINHLSTFALGIDRRVPPQKVLVYLTRNPFRLSDGTTIVYQVPAPGKVTVKVYDLNGDLIRTLAEGIEVPRAGEYSIKWYGNSDNDKFHGSGLYIYVLQYESDDGTIKKTIKKPIGIIK